MIKLKNHKNIVIMTGAGTSAPSCIPTFRGKNGIWNDIDVDKHVNHDSFDLYPNEAWDVFSKLREIITNSEPNAIHHYLSQISNATIITQNIDHYHAEAGSSNVIEYHGNIHSVKCTSCEYKNEYTKNDTFDLKCPECGSWLRPDVVLFNEPIGVYAEHYSKRAFRDCDLFVAIGTSGIVSTLSSFIRHADYCGAYKVLINLDKIDLDTYFDEIHYGDAEELVPKVLV